MKVLFLTTYNIILTHEHYFTKNVWKYLKDAKNNCDFETELMAASIISDANDNTYIEKLQDENGYDYSILHINKNEDSAGIVKAIEQFFASISPDVIHTNMSESFDKEAAASLNIPIFVTIHVGGVICPRGVVNGFLRYDDTICSQPISKKCTRCVCQDLPFPSISRLLCNLVTEGIAKSLFNKIHNNIFYLTPLLMAKMAASNSLEYLKWLKKTHIIAANQKLVDLLALNGIKDNVHLLPHGVAARKSYPFPRINGVVKFFYLGRITYSKGLHIILEALKDIDPSLYEFHVIGDGGTYGPSCRYMQKMINRSVGMNVIYHGDIPNEEIEEIIKDMHVMILPTICMEVYGIAVAESLSVGRPALVTKCGGGETQIKDGMNGWIIEPNDPKAMHEKIEYLIKNPKKIYKAAENSILPHPADEYAKQLWILYYQAIMNEK